MGLYPDWLSFSGPEESWGINIIIKPYVNLEKALRRKRIVLEVSNTIERRINMFMNRYFPENSR